MNIDLIESLINLISYFNVSIVVSIYSSYNSNFLFSKLISVDLRFAYVFLNSISNYLRLEITKSYYDN